MDIAQIKLIKNENGTYPFVSDIECDMPTYGQLSFKIYHPKKEVFFLQYANYPLVNLVAGSNLYMGIHSIPFIIKVIPTLGGPQRINEDNINSFFIGILDK